MRRLAVFLLDALGGLLKNQVRKERFPFNYKSWKPEGKGVRNMSESNQLGTYKTSIRRNKGGQTKVVYYKTAVVTFTDDQIWLDTGGWWTRTTRVRMNQASRQFQLGYRVYEKGSKWYIAFGNKSHDFSANQMKLDRRTGQVTPVG